MNFSNGLLSEKLKEKVEGLKFKAGAPISTESAENEDKQQDGVGVMQVSNNLSDRLNPLTSSRQKQRRYASNPVEMVRYKSAALNKS